MGFDMVMLNDVMEHIEKKRYGCLFSQLDKVTHPGSIVYMHTPTPMTQIADRGQYFENVVPHHFVTMGMAMRGFELVQFEHDVDTVCGGKHKDLPRPVKQCEVLLQWMAQVYSPGLSQSPQQCCSESLFVRNELADTGTIVIDNPRQK